MSWVAQNFISTYDMKFFGNYALANGDHYYRGYGEDIGCYRYYLSEYGYIIANSFLPFEIMIHNQICTTDFKGYDGMYRYMSASYCLYFHRQNIGKFIIIPRKTNGYSGFGLEPVRYSYKDANGQLKNIGTPFYSGDLRIGNNQFTGYNEFEGKTLNVRIRQNFYKHNGKGEYIHTLDSSKKKLFGVPTYETTLHFSYLFRKVDLDNTGILFENSDKSIQFKEVLGKLVYGIPDSDSGWWQCSIPKSNANFTLKFKKLANSEATGKDIECKFIGLTEPQNFQYAATYYGDLLRWI